MVREDSEMSIKLPMCTLTNLPKNIEKKLDLNPKSPSIMASTRLIDLVSDDEEVLTWYNSL